MIDWESDLLRAMAVRPLPLQACLGFGGTVGNGLILHPDKKTLIYPLGTTIVLRDKVRKSHQPNKTNKHASSHEFIINGCCVSDCRGMWRSKSFCKATTIESPAWRYRKAANFSPVAKSPPWDSPRPLSCGTSSRAKSCTASYSTRHACIDSSIENPTSEQWLIEPWLQCGISISRACMHRSFTSTPSSNQ